jgi:FKBP-type peptidyl-prolyl cis-trans isomerase FklB
MRIVVVAALCLAFAACEKGAGGGSASLKTELDSVSYAVGLNLGKQALRDSINLNGDAIAAGLRDAADTTKAKMTEAQVQQVMMSFQQKLMAKQQGKMQEDMKKDSAASIGNKAEGEKFLAENKSKPGVVTLPSGLQYKVIKEGTGPTPTSTDSVVVHYTGKLINGKVFDSSIERKVPATFTLNSVIPGWTQALQLMKVGSKWQVYIPSTLAYGPSKQGDIPGNSALVFDVELLDIKK